MILLAFYAVAALVLAAGIGAVTTALVYRRRLVRLSDQLEIAREVIEDAEERLREFGDVWAEAPVPGFEKELAAVAADLASGRGFRRRLARFNARHAGADLPRT